MRDADRSRPTPARVAGVALLVLVSAAALAAPDARFLGVRNGRALLAVGAQTLALAPGERGPGDLQVVAVNARRVWVREAGRTWVLAVGGAPVALAGEVSVARGSDGRYRTDARVRGRSLPAEIDPQAGDVLVPAALAARAGIVFERRAGRRARVRGRDVLAFPVRLAEVSVDGVSVADVPALVVEDRQVTGLVLGRPYLARFDRIPTRDGTLLLGVRRTD